MISPLNFSFAFLDNCHTHPSTVEDDIHEDEGYQRIANPRAPKRINHEFCKAEEVVGGQNYSHFVNGFLQVHFATYVRFHVRCVAHD